MPYEMIPELASYCFDCGVEFMSSPFSVEDARAVDPYVKKHKIASYEMMHLHLIEYAARSGKPLVLSTGAATSDEIEWSLRTFRSLGGTEVTLMQCTAKYPAPLSSLNLRAIPEMKERFGVNVGLSDHSRGNRFCPCHQAGRDSRASIVSAGTGHLADPQARFSPGHRSLPQLPPSPPVRTASAERDRSPSPLSRPPARSSKPSRETPRESPHFASAYTQE